MPTASTAATKIWIRAKAVSVVQPARAAVSTRGRARLGKTASAQFQIRLPSMSRNSVANSASRSPAATWPAVEPTLSTPLQIGPVSWL